MDLDPSPSIPLTARPRGQRISSETWMEQRPRFQRLYVDLDMSLQDTMRTMEEMYAFKARYKSMN